MIKFNKKVSSHLVRICCPLSGYEDDQLVIWVLSIHGLTAAITESRLPYSDSITNSPENVGIFV